MKPGFVDIVIVNLNGKHFLEKCLKSISKQTLLTPYHVVIVDNGSNDGSYGWVNKHFPDTLWIQNKSNTGFSYACNQGIRATNSEFILLLNNDTEFKNDVLQFLTQFQQEHLDAGIIGPVMKYPDGNIQPSIKHFPPIWKFVVQQFGLARLFSKPSKLYFPFGPFVPEDYQAAHKVDWLSGACIFFPRYLCEKIGLLDEEMPFGVEDMDYGRRAIAGGFVNYFVPDACLVHYKGGSHLTNKKKGVQRNEFILFSYTKGMKLYFRKYHSLFSTWIVNLAISFNHFVGRILSR